jgi:hypothetical protein
VHQQAEFIRPSCRNPVERTDGVALSGWATGNPQAGTQKRSYGVEHGAAVGFASYHSGRSITMGSWLALCTRMCLPCLGSQPAPPEMESEWAALRLFGTSPHLVGTDRPRNVPQVVSCSSSGSNQPAFWC